MQGTKQMETVQFGVQLEYVAFITLEHFIAKGNVHKLLIVVLHTMQVTQAMSLLKDKPKTVFDITYDDLAPRMAIILSIHALNLHGLVNNQKHEW